MPIGVYEHRQIPLAERFWFKVNKNAEGGCWVWTASTMVRTGYGQIRVGKTTKLAHRLAYELEIGPIPDGLQIDHLCRNRVCVNPAHLEPVLQQVNNIRSESFSAKNAKKTHCIHGHEFNDLNTHVKRTGSRECKACASARELRRIR